MNDVTLAQNYVMLFAAKEMIFVDSNSSTNLNINDMPILTIFIVILVVGVILWLVNTYIPMQSTIKSILNAVVVIILVIWLLKVFGVLESLQNLTV